jgi:hypothetical protein
VDERTAFSQHQGVLLVYGLVAWFAFMITGVVNGTFRVAVLQASVREYPAHVISTLLLCGALLVEISLFLDIVGDYSQGWMIALGVMWALLTVAFEFGFGRAVGQSWATLLENYDVPHGRIWALVLIVLLVMPVVAG